MKKSFLAGTLVVVMIAAILAAGCTNPTTSSPTPTPSASTTTSAAEEQAVTQYLTNTMQQRNFTVVTPFLLQASPQAGVAVYNATVSDSNGTYAVSVRAFNTTQAAQAQFLSLRNTYMGQGYSALFQNATAWSGFNASARMGAAVEYGTSPLIPYYMMVITGGAVGQAPFQQTMWQDMWDEMHEHLGNYGGMGPYMGYGLSNDTINDMRNEMQEHLGSGQFGPGMMDGS